MPSGPATSPPGCGPCATPTAPSLITMGADIQKAFVAAIILLPGTLNMLVVPPQTSSAARIEMWRVQASTMNRTYRAATGLLNLLTTVLALATFPANTRPPSTGVHDEPSALTETLNEVTL